MTRTCQCLSENNLNGRNNIRHCFLFAEQLDQPLKFLGRKIVVFDIQQKEKERENFEKN